MSKHTQGPWAIAGTEIVGDGMTVATISELSPLTPRQVANARLIAAAPELLEALKLCYEHCRLYHPEVEQNNVGKAARAAIAKAEGAA